MEDSQGSLPAGWIIEIKTRKNGSKAGKCYKCYIDLLTGRKFYSKEAVSRYLKSRKLDSEKSRPKKQRKINSEASKSKNKRKLDSETYKSKNIGKLGSETSKPKNKRKLNSETSKPKKKRKLDSETSKPKKKRKLDDETSGPKNKKTYTPCPDNVASQNERWPDCLPPGWTKEIKYRNRIGAGFRRDMYYTDPVTGFVFRSKVDVLRYLETGELGKDAKPKKQSTSNTQSIGNTFSSPVAAKQEKSARRVAAKQEKSARRCLFDSDRLNSDGKTTEKIGTSPLGVQDSTGCSKRRQSGHSKRRQSERIQAAQIMEKESPELEDSKQPSKSLENGVPLEYEDNHQQQPETRVLSKLADKKLLKNAVPMESEDKKLQTNGWTLECKNKKLSENVGPSESEGKKLLEDGLLLNSVDKNPLSKDKVPENGPLLKSAGKKLLKNVALLKSTKKKLGKRELMKSKNKKQMDTGPQVESVDKKQKDTGPRMEAKDEKPLYDGLVNANKVPPESEEKKLKRELMKSKDKKQMDTGPQMESVDKKQKDTGSRMEAKDEKPLDDGLANPNMVPPESEEKKLKRELMKSKEKKQMDTGQQKDTGPRMEAKDEKPLDDGLANANMVPPESEEKKLKRELMKTKEKKQMDTGQQMESVDKQQKDTGPRMEAKDEKPLDVGLANVNKVPPESEEKKLLQNEVEKREAKSIRAHSRKAKAGKVSILPQRASKRLAGLEANPVVFQDPDLACRLATKQKMGPAPSGATEACQAGKVEAEKLTVIEAEKPIPDEAEKPADENMPQSPLVLPFGDSWPDPCLEFAFKTLTGDIPMDTLEIEGYFQQQLGMAQPQSPGCDSLFEPQVLLGPSNGSLPCFLDNELPANGGKERERNAKGKN